MVEFGLIVIRTNQVQNLVEFYSNLGIEFYQHKHGNGPIHFAAEVNSVIFEIYPLSKNQMIPDKYTRIGFLTENLDALIRKLDKSKIQSPPLQKPWGLTAVILDPDGRKVELTEKND